MNASRDTSGMPTTNDHRPPPTPRAGGTTQWEEPHRVAPCPVAAVPAEAVHRRNEREAVWGPRRFARAGFGVALVGLLLLVGLCSVIRNRAEPSTIPAAPAGSAGRDVGRAARGTATDGRCAATEFAGLRAVGAAAAQPERIGSTVNSPNDGVGW